MIHSGMPCLSNKHQTRLERLAREKHYNFLQAFINDGIKKFYNIRVLVANHRCQTYKSSIYFITECQGQNSKTKCPSQAFSHWANCTGKSGAFPSGAATKK